MFTWIFRYFPLNLHHVPDTNATQPEMQQKEFFFANWSSIFLKIKRYVLLHHAVRVCVDIFTDLHSSVLSNFNTHHVTIMIPWLHHIFSFRQISVWGTLLLSGYIRSVCVLATYWQFELWMSNKIFLYRYLVCNGKHLYYRSKWWTLHSVRNLNKDMMYCFINGVIYHILMVVLIRTRSAHFLTFWVLGTVMIYLLININKF